MGTRNSELKNSTYEVFVGALSVLSIVNIFLFLLIPDDAVQSVVVIIDLILSLAFLSDFAYRLLTADSKRQYFFRQFGWADLGSGIPLPPAKILRLSRIFRTNRLLREYGAEQVASDFIENRAQSALLLVFLLIILLLEFAGMGMVWAEQDAPNANIKTGGDSLWFAYVTITTVGYGDEYPVTTAGRIIGVFILTMGVGLFGVLTGFLANFFLTPRRRPLLERRRGEGASSRLMIAQIRHAIDLNDQQQKEIRQRLDELERMLPTSGPER